MKTKNLVTKDMTIGEVVGKYPETSSIMLSYGLHCVGCAVNPYETIEQGCLGHGIDKKTITNLIKDINKAIKNKKEGIKKEVSITKNAVQKLKEFMKEEGKINCGVRLSVINSGTALQYSLDFADKPNKDEKVFTDNGIKVFVQKDFIEIINGTEIDYIDNERGSGFKIENKNSTEGCGSGCGCS